MLTKLETVRRDRKIFRTELVRVTERLFGPTDAVGESTIYEVEKGKKSPTVKTMQKIKAGINTLSGQKYPPVSLEDICECDWQ